MGTSGNSKFVVGRLPHTTAASRGLGSCESAKSPQKRRFAEAAYSGKPVTGGALVSRVVAAESAATTGESPVLPNQRNRSVYGFFARHSVSTNRNAVCPTTCKLRELNLSSVSFSVCQ